MATNPRSTSPEATARNTRGIDGKATRSNVARSGWVRSASSPKVPWGPRKPTRGVGDVVAMPGR